MTLHLFQLFSTALKLAGICSNLYLSAPTFTLSGLYGQKELNEPLFELVMFLLVCQREPCFMACLAPVSSSSLSKPLSCQPLKRSVSLLSIGHCQCSNQEAFARGVYAKHDIVVCRHCRSVPSPGINCQYKCHVDMTFTNLEFGKGLTVAHPLATSFRIAVTGPTFDFQTQKSIGSNIWSLKLSLHLLPENYLSKWFVLGMQGKL